MALLKIGSQGSSVKELQKLLNQAGYNLSVDGIFGDKTQSAVRAYQKANNLGVDGIVGDQTWGSLRGGSSFPALPDTNPEATAPETVPDTQMKEPEATAPEATQPSEEVMDALANDDALNQILAAKPGSYQSPYMDKINQLYEQIMNRPAFEYNFDADPIYQQYKDRYIQQGQRAMQDATANAAALTGGYGNSYAASAGQQAYDQYLTGLNDVIGTLAQNAYGRYQGEGQALYDLLAATQGLEEGAYNQYMDALNAWINDRNFTYNQYLNNRDFAYQQQQDKLAQENWQKEFELASGEQNGPDGSPAYNSVLANAAQLKSSKVLGYLQQMVEGGYITQAEADYIYAVELAGGLLSGSGGGSSGSSSKSSSSSSSKKTTVTAEPTVQDIYDIYNAVGRTEGEKGLADIANKMTELLPEAIKNTTKSKNEQAASKREGTTKKTSTQDEIKKKFQSLLK